MKGCFTGSFLLIPTHGGGDVIVVAGNIQRKEVVDMENGFYAGIGFAVVWCMKYICIPIGTAVLARIIADRLLRPQPDKQKKKRF